LPASSDLPKGETTMAPSNANVGDTVELKDKDGGFTDPVTGFDISRDQKLKLTDPIGARTQEAIVSGGLLVVSGKKKSSDEGDKGGANDSGFPEDFPGREAFAAAKLTREEVDALDRDGLIAVKGIGEKTADAIIEARGK
jgi:hypothetical protein